MKKLRNNKIRKLLAFMVALALMVSCMPSAYTISASEAFGDGTEDIFTDGEITSEPAAEESTPDVSSADQEETEQAQQSTLTYENDSVKVTAEALEDGALPQNTALKADSVNENSFVSYDTVSQKLSAAATDKGSSLRGFFAYDVYFADGDGNRVEPNGRVRVTFEYKTPAAPELTDAASTSVTVEKLHYNSSTGDTDVNTLQANEDLKVLNVNEGKQIQTLQVETGNTAVFAVMWDSPETADVEAERFLKKEYFLTSQQRDIERQILKRIRGERGGYFWFSGLPGTGKTLLLYDIAMKLSVRQRVCIIHCGEAGKEWKILHERLRRIDFLADTQLDGTTDLGCYSSILVDEAHLLSLEKLSVLLTWSEHRPVIFSSDSEDVISPEEMDRSIVESLGNLPEIQKFHLTNRIRTNAELSSFIQNMMHLPEKRSPRWYPHIAVVYANNDREVENFLNDFAGQGYQQRIPEGSGQLGIQAVRDAEKIVVLLDEQYYYDEKGYLRSRCSAEKYSSVRKLFHLLNQAKESLALVVRENMAVYEVMMEILQMHRNR